MKFNQIKSKLQKLFYNSNKSSIDLENKKNKEKQKDFQNNIFKTPNILYDSGWSEFGTRSFVNSLFFARTEPNQQVGYSSGYFDDLTFDIAEEFLPFVEVSYMYKSDNPDVGITTCPDNISRFPRISTLRITFNGSEIYRGVSFGSNTLLQNNPERSIFPLSNAQPRHETTLEVDYFANVDPEDEEFNHPFKGEQSFTGLIDKFKGEKVIGEGFNGQENIEAYVTNPRGIGKHEIISLTNSSITFIGNKTTFIYEETENTVEEEENQEYTLEFSSLKLETWELDDFPTGIFSVNNSSSNIINRGNDIFKGYFLHSTSEKNYHIRPINLSDDDEDHQEGGSQGSGVGIGNTLQIEYNPEDLDNFITFLSTYDAPNELIQTIYKVSENRFRFFIWIPFFIYSKAVKIKKIDIPQFNDTYFEADLTHSHSIRKKQFYFPEPGIISSRLLISVINPLKYDSNPKIIKDA